MKQFNPLFGTLAGVALTLASVQGYAGNSNGGYNENASNVSAIALMADNSSTTRNAADDPAMGGEGDGAMGGNAPNPTPDRDIGVVVDDATITAEVKAKLLADTMVSGLKIDVDTRSGVVYLTGDNMNSQASIDQAIKLAKSTEGVQSVVSKLAVGDIKR